MGTQIGGDFIGFSFGGVHSSTLGIVRVSDGSRYNENLLPTFQDKTVQVPGGDGMYYFGSYYTQRQFNISIAYDNLTEEDIKNIQKTFGNKKPQKLIFDETPYKYYWAKSTGTPNLKFICFSDPSKVTSEYIGEGRLYKGEGTLTFICYDPFGYSVSRYVEGINDEYLRNRDDWFNRSGLLAQGNTQFREGDYNTTIIQKDNVFGAGENGYIDVTIENNGDLETSCLITVTSKLKENNDAVFNPINLEIKKINLTNNQEETLMKIENLELVPGDSKIKINSKNNLIYGANYDFDTKNVYNQYIKFGDFFNLPVGTAKLRFYPDENTHVGIIKFHYKYY